MVVTRNLFFCFFCLVVVSLQCYSWEVVKSKQIESASDLVNNGVVVVRDIYTEILGEKKFSRVIDIKENSDVVLLEYLTGVVGTSYMFKSYNVFIYNKKSKRIISVVKTKKNGVDVETPISFLYRTVDDDANVEMHGKDWIFENDSVVVKGRHIKTFTFKY